MRYCVLDIEVDAVTKRKRFCDAFEPTHKIIMIQQKVSGSETFYQYNREGLSREESKLNLDGIDLLVGQNIKFDLLYLWNNKDLQEFIARGGLVWCTSTADYLLKGQEKSPRDLDSLVLECGGTQKIDVVKEHFKSGKLFSEIDKDVAVEYGIADVVNTDLVFRAQLKRAKELQMVDILKVHMSHLWAICEMEFNGVQFNRNRLWELSKLLSSEIEELGSKLITYVREHSDWPLDELKIDLNSPQHISLLLFGGELKVPCQVPWPDKSGSLIYKTGKNKGKPRTKKGIEVVYLRGFKLRPSAPSKVQGIYETNEEALKTYLSHPFVEILFKYRQVNKLLSTYYYNIDTSGKETGFYPLINPDTGCIHGEFKQTVTATGRLSCRNPNLQNLPSQMRELVESRFEGGVIVTADYSQLEVCVAGWMFNDETMLQEIKQSVDIHSELARILFNKQDISKAERKLTKAFTYGLLYGEGYKTMSLRHEVSEEIAKRFINIFYKKYRAIEEGHKQLVVEVGKNSRYMSDAGYSVGFIKTPLNRRYWLREYENSWGRKYSPTQLKNYKMQGTAADIMSMAAAKVFNAAKANRDKFLMINEVHDELVFDCKAEYVDRLSVFIKKTMEKSSNFLQIGVPLKVDVSVGRTWESAKNAEA